MSALRSADEFRRVIDAAPDGMGRVGAPTTWALSNHDTTRHSTRFAGPRTSSRHARNWDFPEGWGDIGVEARTGDRTRRLSCTAARSRCGGRIRGSARKTPSEWADAPAGVLVLRRQGFVCTTNTTDEAVRILAPGRPLLAGFPIGPTNGSHGAAFEPDANATVRRTI